MATLTEPRVDPVQQAADDVCHIICGDCWKPGQPSMCGALDDDSNEHDEGCTHPSCPLCEMAWEAHWCGR